jgi:hypothetical protein
MRLLSKQWTVSEVCLGRCSAGVWRPVDRLFSS